MLTPNLYLQMIPFSYNQETVESTSFLGIPSPSKAMNLGLALNKLIKDDISLY
jgi:hypothetical protein